MREIIAIGKTVEEATENGCKELGKTRDEVSVEIIDMPLRKLFKTIPAKIRITVNEEVILESFTVAKVEKKAEPIKTELTKTNLAAKKETINKVKKEEEIKINLNENAPAMAAVDYLTEIFNAIGAGQFEITALKQGDATLLRVEGETISNVIETRGETVQALSYLTDRAVNKGVDKKDDNYIRVRLDVAGYRNRREGELVALATRIGKEVAATKRSRTLAPMNPYERLIIHTAISEIEGVISESKGSDNDRRVVIKSTDAGALDGGDWKESVNRKGGAHPRSTPQSSPRGPRSNNSSGKRNQSYNNKPAPRSNTPEREYANKTKDENASPVVPERREAIKDGEDMPLYGKIDI